MVFDTEAFEMKCENKFCIYFSDNECILDEAELDIQGSCTKCIYINLSEKELTKKRIELLSKL